MLRSLISDSLQTDEAEQCLVTQVWLWGYGSQPPLYTWLQIPLFSVFGVNVFALSLLKNALLFSIYAFTFLTAKEIFRETHYALVATFSLLLIVLFAWESQRDQTHLVLATAIATATLYVAVRLYKTRAAVWYCLLGMLAALGVLAKYNYAVMIVSLLLAATSLPAIRPAVLNRRMLLAIVLFLLVIAPHAHWAWTNPQLLFSQANKFNIPESGSILIASLKGSGVLLKRVLEFTVGPLVVFGFLSFRAPTIVEPAADRTLVTWIQRMIVIGLALCLITVFAFHVTSIRARWLQPLLVSLPLVLVAWAQPRLDPKRISGLFAIAAVVMLLVPTTMYGTIAGAGWFGRATNVNTPYRAFAEQIRLAGFTRGLIVAESHLLAGNLRLQFPDSTIVAAGNIEVLLPSAHQMPTLLAWRPTDKQEVPETLLSFSVTKLNVEPTRIQAKKISAPAVYAPDKTERLQFAIIDSSTAGASSVNSHGSAMQ